MTPSLPPTSPVPRKLSREVYDVAARVWANGPAPLLEPVAGHAPSASGCAWRW